MHDVPLSLSTPVLVIGDLYSIRQLIDCPNMHCPRRTNLDLAKSVGFNTSVGSLS